MKGSIAALAAVSAAIGALGASLWATARPDEGPGRQRTWSGLRTLESIDPGTPVGPGFGIGAGDGQPRALVLITQPGSYVCFLNSIEQEASLEGWAKGPHRPSAAGLNWPATRWNPARLFQP
ncbi:hypothetical protein J4558_08390 [Leptolyngbya sp. 15MV]|nr:hypothetical protein J4558_08390 [Leptolyngbya sp. 15MV]